MRRLTIGIAAALAAACGGSSYGGNPPACTATSATATTAVSLSGMEFVPSCVKISPGATLTFTNDDPVAHTVTTDAGQPETFDSGTLAAMGGVFSHPFALTAETVHVHCTIHPAMKATIFVE